MTPEIRKEPFSKDLFGATLTHDPSKTYGEEILELLDDVWIALKEHHIKHQGVSYALYGKDQELFAGVELTVPVKPPRDFTIKKIAMHAYAYWKHVGPYRGLPEVHIAVKNALLKMGIRYYEPAIEIYGHWTPDESRLETEILYPIT